MNKLFRNIFALIPLLVILFSCNKYESSFTDIEVDEAIQFDGTIVEFLEQGQTEVGISFDSMLVAINGIPGLKDSLEQDTANLTLFAVPNDCFREAIIRLNAFRASKEKGAPIYLNDLLIDPFTVIEKQPGDTPEADSIIIEHHYDYRLQLDSLVSRYIFKGAFNTGSLAEYINGLQVEDFRFHYRMQLQYDRENASGITGMGRRRLVLSDKNGTDLAINWSSSEMQIIDVKAKNGYIHIVNNSHEFSFGKLIANFQNYGNEYIYE